MGLRHAVVQGRTGSAARVWSATCDETTEFTSVASVNPGISFARIGGTVSAHVRGPETRATTLPCPPDAEFFGVDLRIGAYLPAFPPGAVADLHDAELPVLANGRLLLLDNDTWEMPTPENVDVFLGRLERADLLRFDPLVEELHHGTVRGVPVRTAQSRYRRAVGLSRRLTEAVERAREAARLLRLGTPIADVAQAAGYYDQPHLTRAVRRHIGRTPAELAASQDFLDL